MHQKNIELSKDKKIYLINTIMKEKRIFNSLTKASIELNISISTISGICNNGKWVSEWVILKESFYNYS